MSNATNITNNPADACPRFLQYHIPNAWRDSTSSNFSQAACAAPACDNFPTTLAQCCGRAESDLYYFNTTIGPFASCAIANSNDTEAYQAFQRCLADKEVRNFRCNDPSLAIAPACGFGIETNPNDTNDLQNQQTCSLPISVNATRAMKKCCSNYNGGDGLLIYSEGCYIGCTSNSTNDTFHDCIGENYDNIEGYLCTINDGKEKPHTGVGAQASPSLAGIITVLLLGSSMLLL